jgi:hypothetical protein
VVLGLEWRLIVCFMASHRVFHGKLWFETVFSFNACCWYSWRIYRSPCLSCSIRLRATLCSSTISTSSPSTYSHSAINRLFSLDLICGLLDVFSVYQSALVLVYMLHNLDGLRIYRGRCSIASTYFTKLSSSLLFALMGGEVGASAFLPPMASAAPPMVMLRVAIASCEVVILA